MTNKLDDQPESTAVAAAQNSTSIVVNVGQSKSSTSVKNMSDLLAAKAQQSKPINPANYDLIKANGGTRSTYYAVHKPTGIRSKFECMEHINVGQAWLLRDTEGLVPNIVTDDSLTEMTVAVASPKSTITWG